MARKRKGEPPQDLGKAIDAGYQPMFMTSNEVVKHLRLGDTSYYVKDDTPSKKEKPFSSQEMDQDTLEYKLHDSMHPQSHDGKESLYDSIKREGVTTPLKVSRSPLVKRPILSDGHHRLAVSKHLNPNQFLPIEYH